MQARCSPLSCSAYPASSSTVVGEQDDLRRRIDEYMLHQDYHQSIIAEDGEAPIEVLESPHQTDMDSYNYSGPSTDLADAASLPRRPRGTPWPTCTTPPCEEPTRRPELSTKTRTPEPYIAYVEGAHIPGPACGAPDRTAEVLAKLLSASRDPDVTALSEAVRAKLGITEPLIRPAATSHFPGLTSFADDLKRLRVSRLLPKVTCPSPFHPRARTVPIAELQDVLVAEAGMKEPTALAPLACRLSPLRIHLRGCEDCKPISQANIRLELLEFDPKILPEWAGDFAEFLLLTGQSNVDVATKFSLLKPSCKKKFLLKKVKQIVKPCSTWADVLQRLEKTFPVYEMDLSLCRQIEELTMLPEFPSAVRISEYVCNLQYLFSKMNMGSYRPTEPHLWLVGKIPLRTWEDYRPTSERKQRTHTYKHLVELLIELALERENNFHM